MIWTPSPAARIVLGLFTRIVARIVRSEKLFQKKKKVKKNIPKCLQSRLLGLWP